MTLANNNLAEDCEWVSFLNYLFKCHQYHLKSVYFCIFSHDRRFGEKCCTYSGVDKLRAERGSEAQWASSTQVNIQVHTVGHTLFCIHTIDTDTVKGSQRKTSPLWMETYVWQISFFFVESSMYFLISLSAIHIIVWYSLSDI